MLSVVTVYVVSYRILSRPDKFQAVFEVNSLSFRRNNNNFAAASAYSRPANSSSLRP